MFDMSFILIDIYQTWRLKLLINIKIFYKIEDEMFKNVQAIVENIYMGIP